MSSADHSSGFLLTPGSDVSVAVKGDRKGEPDETFTLNLSGADGATLFDSQGSGIIRNDDR